MKNFRLVLMPSQLLGLVLGLLTLFATHSAFATVRFADSEKLKRDLRTLTYANPRPVQYPKQDVASIDDALVLVAKNIEVQRYNRDSLGLEQSQFEIEVDSSSDLVTVRNQIIGWLDAIPLRYEINDDSRGVRGSLKRFSFNFGNITQAEAYFSLRDSLLTLRSKTVRVKVDEVPYSRPQNLDSLRWFLETLQQVEMKNKTQWERFFLKKFFEDRNSYSLDCDLRRGLYCAITAKMPASEVNVEERLKIIPSGMIPFRNTPWELRMEYFQVLVLLCLALSATSLVLTLAFLAIFLWKRRGKSRKAKEGLN